MLNARGFVFVTGMERIHVNGKVQLNLVASALQSDCLDFDPLPTTYESYDHGKIS